MQHDVAGIAFEFVGAEHLKSNPLNPHGEEARSAVSNQEARPVASSFEKRLTPLLRMRIEPPSGCCRQSRCA
jgi:hypothetical protein